MTELPHSAFILVSVCCCNIRTEKDHLFQNVENVANSTLRNLIFLLKRDISKWKLKLDNKSHDSTSKRCEFGVRNLWAHKATHPKGQVGTNDWQSMGLLSILLVEKSLCSIQYDTWRSQFKTLTSAYSEIAKINK